MRVIIHVSKSVERTAPRVNPKVNSGLCVVMTYRYRSINCDQCATVLGDADSGRGCARVGAGLYGNSVPSAQLRCQPKTPLKNKVCLKKKKKALFKKTVENNRLCLTLQSHCCLAEQLRKPI